MGKLLVWIMILGSVASSVAAQKRSDPGQGVAAFRLVGLGQHFLYAAKGISLAQ